MRSTRIVRVSPALFSLAFFLLTACSTNPAASPGQYPDRADSIVDRAITAHGGKSIEFLRSIVQEWKTSDAQVNESRKPLPPWDAVHRWEAFAADFSTQHYAEARIDLESGYDYITGLILDGSRGYRLDYRSETYRDSSVTFDQAIVDMSAWSPIVLLRWLTEHRDAASYVARRDYEGGEVDAVELGIGGQTVTVFFDVSSGKIRELERSYTDFDGTRIPLRFIYKGETIDNGVRYPSIVELWSHGYLTRRATLASMQVDVPIDEYLVVPDTIVLTQSEPKDIRTFRIEELADGVTFVGQGVMYQLIVEFDHFLVALDGCSGDVMKRISAIQERIPNKNFRYVLASHHHNDHLHGLDEFVAAGADVLASSTHTKTIVDYVRKQLPEISPTFVSVDKRVVVRSGSRELQIIDIGPVPHSDHTLVAYLPKEHILFAADLFVLGGRRHPVKPASINAIALLEAIDDLSLDAETIVDPHSPIIATIDDLRQAVALRREKDSKIIPAARMYLRAWQSAAKELDDRQQSIEPLR